MTANFTSLEQPSRSTVTSASVESTKKNYMCTPIYILSSCKQERKNISYQLSSVRQVCWKVVPPPPPGVIPSPWWPHSQSNLKWKIICADLYFKLLQTRKKEYFLPIIICSSGSLEGGASSSPWCDSTSVLSSASLESKKKNYMCTPVFELLQTRKKRILLTSWFFHVRTGLGPTSTRRTRSTSHTRSTRYQVHLYLVHQTYHVYQPHFHSL